MGMDLTGAGGDFRFSNTSSTHVLNLAVAHGWEPAGTKEPERDDESEEADASKKPKRETRPGLTAMLSTTTNLSLRKTPQTWPRH